MFHSPYASFVYIDGNKKRKMFAKPLSSLCGLMTLVTPDRYGDAFFRWWDERESEADRLIVSFLWIDSQSLQIQYTVAQATKARIEKVFDGINDEMAYHAYVNDRIHHLWNYIHAKLLAVEDAGDIIIKFSHDIIQVIDQQRAAPRTKLKLPWRAAGADDRIKRSEIIRSKEEEAEGNSESEKGSDNDEDHEEGEESEEDAAQEDDVRVVTREEADAMKNANATDPNKRQREEEAPFPPLKRMGAVIVPPSPSQAPSPFNPPRPLGSA